MRSVLAPNQNCIRNKLIYLEDKTEVQVLRQTVALVSTRGDPLAGL